jgi:hypothetical protein
MYGATFSGLIELLLFYAALFVSACLCFVAILITFEPGGSRKSPKKFAVGSMIGSAICGFSYMLLLASGVFSKGHGAALGWLVFIPVFISVIICWFGPSGSK